MAITSINLGTAGTQSGDTIRAAFGICNSNFSDLDTGKMSTSHAANSITGFGTSGAATTVARSDHAHSGSDISSGTISADRLNDEAKGWHGYAKIMIKPADFIPNDDDVNANVAMVDNGAKIKVTNAALEAYAQYTIPKGYKATEIMLYGNTANAVDVATSGIDSSTITLVSPAESVVGTAINITDVTGTDAGYLIVKWSPTATTHYLYGGYIQLVAV